MNVKVRMPKYVTPRNKWRRLIHAATHQAFVNKNIHYSKADKIELNIVLYLNEEQIRFHDIDNRLKDIMDALQGRAGGSKAKKTLDPIVPNDKQVYRVVIEKKKQPKQSHGLGHLIIRKYRFA